MNEDKLYAFIMRGELTKSALEKTETVSNYQREINDIRTFN